MGDDRLEQARGRVNAALGLVASWCAAVESAGRDGHWQDALIGAKKLENALDQLRYAVDEVTALEHEHATR